MPFKNRIRLPFYVTRPQYPREANVFRRADGSTKVQSVIIRKVFEGETDNLPKEIHERFIIALSHDDVTIEGRYLSTGVSLDSDYDIDWLKFLDHPLAKAAFKVQVTPFNYSNDNCQTCEEVSQVVCEDDDIGVLDEDETVSVPVLENDSICCKPVTISLVTYNSDFLDSCIVSGSEIVIHTKPSLPSANSVLLVTYRAQCPNGSYDEANVIANINGSEVACLAPTDLVITAISDIHCYISWAQPFGALSYEWQLYLLSDLSTQVDGGTANTTENAIDLMGLTPATQYRFYVNTVCADDDRSNSAYIDFTTDPASGTDTCGSYELFNSDPADFHIGNYLDCNGVQQFVNIPPFHQRVVCALQNSPGTPADMSVDFEINITYLGLC